MTASSKLQVVGQKAAKSVHIAERILKNSPVFIGLIIITAIIFAGLLFLNLLAGDPKLSGLFVRGIANVSLQFPLNITPAGYAFSIWGVIYLLQTSWLIYSLALICRTTDNGPAYLNPIIISPAFLIFFNFSSFANVGWLFMWDRLFFLASFVTLVCTSLSLFLALGILSSRLVKFRDQLIDEGRRNELRFLVAGATNGVAMYATWTAIATLINLGIVLTYKFDVFSNENSSVICVGILSILAAVYIVLDFLAISSYTQFLYAPYVTVIWAVSAVLAENYDSDNLSSNISVILLGVVALVFVAKLGGDLYQSRIGNQQYEYRQMKMGKVGNPDPVM